MVDFKTYTTAGYSPRSSRHSAFKDHVDIVYNVFQESLPDNPVPPSQQINFLLLHGSQLSKEVWNYYVELLFKHYGSKLDRVITVDALNSGDSALANAGNIGWYHSWEDLARDHVQVVKDITRRDGLPGPLFAMGHSMGGAETLFLASQFPWILAGAILLDPVWGVDNIFANPHIGPVMGKLLNSVYKRSRYEFESRDEYNEFIDNKFVTAPFHPRIREDLRHASVVERNGKLYMKSSREQQVGSYGGSLTLGDHSTTTFAHAPIPVLVAYGEAEDWNPKGSNDTLAEMLPKAEVAVIKNGGHIVFFQQPEASLEAIYPFVDRISAEWIEESQGTIRDEHDTQETFRKWVRKLSNGINKL